MGIWNKRLTSLKLKVLTQYATNWEKYKVIYLARVIATINTRQIEDLNINYKSKITRK